MKRLGLALALCLSLIGGALAQGGMGPGPGMVHSVAAYAGPGDVVSGARFWYGLRAYSLAKAGTAAARICNASDANCADVNTLANGDFDVATATGAPLNCGGAGGTCTIRTLYDQTTGNNCTGATCDLGNATIGNRPTLTFNCIGSLPCMTFTSASSQVLTAANALSSTSVPHTYSAAARTTNTAAARHLVGTNPATATQIGYPTTNDTVQAFSGATRTATASAGSYHALQAVLSLTGDMNVDGTPTTGSTGNGGTMSATISLGAISGTQFMSGTVLEAGGWANKAFNSTESSNMSANQHAYWGF